jgi:hypothetical protein
MRAQMVWPDVIVTRQENISEFMPRKGETNMTNMAQGRKI